MKLVFELLVQQVVLPDCQLLAGEVGQGSILRWVLYRSQILDLHSLYTHNFSITDDLKF